MGKTQPKLLWAFPGRLFLASLFSYLSNHRLGATSGLTGCSTCSWHHSGWGFRLLTTRLPCCSVSGSDAELSPVPSFPASPQCTWTDRGVSSQLKSRAAHLRATSSGMHLHMALERCCTFSHLHSCFHSILAKTFLEGILKPNQFLTTLQDGPAKSLLTRLSWVACLGQEQEGTGKSGNKSGGDGSFARKAAPEPAACGLKVSHGWEELLTAGHPDPPITSKPLAMPPGALTLLAISPFCVKEAGKVVILLYSPAYPIPTRSWPLNILAKNNSARLHVCSSHYCTSLTKSSTTIMFINLRAGLVLGAPRPTLPHV